MPRRDFLYDITALEARRIIKGFRKRGRFMAELQRLNAWCNFYAFRENKHRETPDQWLPFPWEKEPAPEITDEERAFEQKIMSEYRMGQG